MYNVNFKRLAIGMLPHSLRGTFRHFVAELAVPFSMLHHRLMEYRSGILQSLTYDGSVGGLERMLNDYFRDVLEVRAGGDRILVGDGVMEYGPLVYPEAEHLPVIVGVAKVMPIAEWGCVPFVVSIPDALDGDADIYDKVDRLVEQYKFTGTKHIIQYYE